ncbi:MAG: hypothetical protein V2A79_00095 [Planctomycetota bacterium]
MTRTMRVATISILAAWCWPAALSAQPYLSEWVTFEGAPYDLTAKEMFWQPQYSGSTQGIVLNVTGEDNNSAYRASTWGSSNPDPPSYASYQVRFSWLDAADPYAWVRLTSYNVTPDRPNPSLHTLGKVRFKILNASEYYQGEIGLCLGIRETGVDVPQLANGGTTGPIEWVGVSTNGFSVIEAGINELIESTLLPDDVATTNGAGQTIAISWGPNRVLNSTRLGDDVLYSGYIRDLDAQRIPIPALTVPVYNAFRQIEFDLTTGDVLWDHDLNPVTPLQTVSAGVAAFAGGNGILDAPNDRGTLEHLAITNVTSDYAVYIDFAIDELQFEATVEDPIPTPTVVSPIYTNDTTVTVKDLIATVDLVTLYKNGGSPFDYDTNGVTQVTLTIAAAQEGDVYTATQHDSVTDRTSTESPGVTVTNAPFPGPVINVPPADGESIVGLAGISSTASEVEVFLSTNGTEWDSLGVQVVGGGQTTYDYTAPAPLNMGELLYATMVVEGLTSDPSLVVTVTTNELTTVFCDNFESYANQAAFDAVWAPGPSDANLQLSTLKNATPGGAKSMYSPMGGTSGAAWSSVYTLASRVSGTDTHPLIYTVHMYDTQGAISSSYRQWAEIKDDVVIGGVPNQVVAYGVTSYFSSYSEVLNVNRYFGRIEYSSAHYFNLDGLAPPRTVGWRTFTAVIKTSTVDFYVDGKLAERDMPRDPANGNFNNVYIGSGFSSTYGDAWYDDACITKGRVTFPELAPQKPIPPVVRSPVVDRDSIVTIDGVAEDASLVTVYNAVPQVIGSVSLTPPNTVTSVDVPVTATLVIAGIGVYATQTNLIGVSDNSDTLVVGSGHSTIMLGVGIRETGSGGPSARPIRSPPAPSNGSTSLPTAPRRWA